MNFSAAAGTRADNAIVALGLALSVALVWLVTRDVVPAALFAAGVVAIGVVCRLVFRPAKVEREQDYALPDWSVTVAAIDRPDVAIAITDRAGRLVCANSRYEGWFGIAHAPPRLPVDQPSLDRLGNAARAAWRDGIGRADLVENEGGKWRADARRSGRGDDFLVWQIAPVTVVDPVSELLVQLDGKPGRLLDRAGISAAIVDPDGTIRAHSAGFAERADGNARSVLIGNEFVALLRQDENDRISWAREGRGGAPLTLYYMPLSDPDVHGEPDPALTPSLMIIADAGAGIGGGGAGQVSAASGHLETLLAPLPLGLAIADRDGRLLFGNGAFLRAVGLEGGTLPVYPTDLVVREDKGALSDAIRRFGLGPATSGDIAVRLASQPDEPVSLSLAGVRGLGEAAVLVGVADTTEETRLKRQVAQATKMQAVGQLAGGVAHDFNNVLTAILGTCDLMLLRHTPGDSDYDDIQQIRANSSRAASLTRQLLAFSRQQTLRPQVIQLPDVVAEVSQMLKRLIGEKIQLVVTHDRDLGPVRADPGQLEQVIVNLCVNARDAMQERGDGSGKLTLTTRRVMPADVRAMGNDVMPQGEYTALVVQDTGVGIPPDHLGKIWEPFFTTKEQGRGTGLGLSTVYGIVKQSGGYIFADSEPGKGTRFSVYLPVHKGAPGEAASRLAAVAPAREWAGGGRVLLVEDEDTVRIVAERALTRAGYEVTSARDGEEGLEQVRSGGEFDIVVSDVVMPGLDGPAMVRAIREMRPELPVLFMSGYAEQQLRQEIGIADVHFLPKPFSVQQISDKVGEALAGRQADTGKG